MAVSNAIPSGNDQVIGAHLMNMEACEERGLAQETIYDFYPIEIQRRQVTYTGLQLAKALRAGNLGEARVTITEKWGNHKEETKLMILHPQDRMSGVLGFWHNYHKNNEPEWLFQPALHFCPAWIMPTYHPAILYRPGALGPENYQHCLRFIEYHAEMIQRKEVRPEQYKFPEMPVK